MLKLIELEIFLYVGYFLEYYGNSTVEEKDQACKKMFHKISNIAYDSVCNDEGPQDLMRKVPCPIGQLCPDEDNPTNVVQSYQFSFRVEDLSQPRFWYLSVVSCYRDKNCSWKMSDEDVELSYVCAFY